MGTKRTGPDLARVGGRYSDDWHRIHLNNPRDVVPESNMPAFPWLGEGRLDPVDIAAKMRVLRRVGVPYTEADIDSAAETSQRQDRARRPDRLPARPHLSGESYSAAGAASHAGASP